MEIKTIIKGIGLLRTLSFLFFLQGVYRFILLRVDKVNHHELGELVPFVIMIPGVIVFILDYIFRNVKAQNNYLKFLKIFIFILFLTILLLTIIPQKWW